MAGISPIVTDGFLFTPSLIVTAGFMSGEAPPPDVVTGERGGWGPDPHKKKKKKQPAPWERQDEASVRKSLMAVVEANESRKREAADRQDLEDLLRLMEKMGL
jgi:hypothetical protein